MADLKLDLLTQLNTQKYYEELELGRLAAEPNMNYKIKIDAMDRKLESLVLITQKIALFNVYFGQPQTAQATIPQGSPLPGQSHGE